MRDEQAPVCVDRSAGSPKVAGVSSASTGGEARVSGHRRSGIPRSKSGRVALVCLLAALFGAWDQYLGSTDWPFSHSDAWLADVSLLAAPWMALPFVAGLWARTPRSAAGLGLAATSAGIVGYCLMAWSPIEGARLSVGLIPSQAHQLVPGLVTGPLFGWLGWRWRARRAWTAAALLVAAFLCEGPVLHVVGGHGLTLPGGLSVVLPSPPSTGVVVGEIAFGLLLAVAFGWSCARAPAGGSEGETHALDALW